MNLKIVKRNSDLLEEVTQKYLDLLKDKKAKVQKKKMEVYIESLLMNIEKNIK